MIRAIGFMAGEGDIILASTLCRSFKKKHLDGHLTFACHKKYAHLLPLLFNNPYIDNFHVYNSYDNWPDRTDLDYLKKKNFDIVYDAMPKHQDEHFYKKGIHQVDEMHFMYDFESPKNKQLCLSQWFDNFSGHENTITASVFASGTGHPDQLARTFPYERMSELFNKVQDLFGYKIIRIDTDKNTPLEYSWPASNLSIIDAARLLCSSKLHLTCDTMFSHISAAYSRPTIGWTRYDSYVPVNPRGYYFVNNNIQDIPIEQIIEKVKEKLKE